MDFEELPGESQEDHFEVDFVFHLDEDEDGNKNDVADEYEDVFRRAPREKVWSDVVEIQGQREKSTLYIDEQTKYVYRIQSKDRYVNYMLCSTGSCSGGRATMTHGEEKQICQTAAHNHPPDELHAECRRFREALYYRAKTESTRLSVIYNEEALNTNMAVIRKMPYPRVESAMLRQRNKVFPPIPHSLEDFGRALEDPHYSNRFGSTTDGKPFFREWRTGSEREGTVVLFVSDHLKDAMMTAECYHMDGHFKMIPNIPKCYQMLTIMAEKFNNLFPVVTVLMTRKTKESYKLVFSLVKEHFPGLKLGHVMSDFEKGLLAAIHEEFPEAKLTGCLFHCDQAMCKKSAKLGLRVLLKENDQAGKVVRMCMALPFLPAEKINKGFNDIRAHSDGKPFGGQLKPFLEYVKKTWLDGIGAEHMSVFRRHKRTNNDMESYHKTLVEYIGRPHPNAWSWIEAFRKIEAQHWRRFNLVSTGHAATRCRKKKYRILDANIKRLSDSVHTLTELEFLEAASYHCMTTYKRVAIEEGMPRDAEVLGPGDVAPPPGGQVDELDPPEVQEEPQRPPEVLRGRGTTQRRGTRRRRSPTEDAEGVQPTRRSARVNARGGVARGTNGRDNNARAEQSVGNDENDVEDELPLRTLQQRAQLQREEQLRAETLQELNANRDNLEFQDEHNERLHRREVELHRQRLADQPDLSILNTIRQHTDDETHTPPALFEQTNILLTRDPAAPAAGNWRVNKVFGGLKKKDALIQISELAALVDILPTPTPDTISLVDGEQCLVCQTNVATRYVLPCVHKVYCTECLHKAFKRYTHLGAQNEPVAQNCPHCRCVVGSLL